MIDRRAVMQALAPWAGGTIAPAAWYAEQQGLGQLTYFACGAANPVTVLIAGLLAAAATAAAGRWSSGVWRGHDGAPPVTDHRRFLAGISTLAAAVFLLAIVFQTLAGLIIPGCAR